MDAEDFFVCDQCQREHITLGYDEMKAKHPLAGKDEHNALFFKEETERHIARARRLTEDELRLLVDRACYYEQEYSKAILGGKRLDEFELGQIERLGSAAEQYIDDW